MRATKVKDNSALVDVLGGYGPVLGKMRTGTQPCPERGCSERVKHLGLEGTEEVGEKGILPGERQHPLLHHGALHIIVDQNYILLEGLDSEEFLFAFQLCKQHLKCGCPC